LLLPFGNPIDFVPAASGRRIKIKITWGNTTTLK